MQLHLSPLVLSGCKNICPQPFFNQHLQASVCSISERAQSVAIANPIRIHHYPALLLLFVIPHVSQDLFDLVATNKFSVQLLSSHPPPTPPSSRLRPGHFERLAA